MGCRLYYINNALFSSTHSIVFLCCSLMFSTIGNWRWPISPGSSFSSSTTGSYMAISSLNLDKLLSFFSSISISPSLRLCHNVVKRGPFVLSLVKVGAGLKHAPYFEPRCILRPIFSPMWDNSKQQALFLFPA